jgi:hypothetical protein
LLRPYYKYLTGEIIMGMESKFVWMNGELVPFEKATIHMLTPALH